MGAPGTSPSRAKIMPVARIALGWALNCPSTSLFRLLSDTERVTIIPVAVEIIRAGSWDTRPSPMVAMEYWFKTVARSPPPCTMPMIKPATKLMTVIISDMTASPLTILVAPSMAP